MLPEPVRNVLPSLEMRNFRRERHRKSFILSDYELPEGLKVTFVFSYGRNCTFESAICQLWLFTAHSVLPPRYF